MRSNFEASAASGHKDEDEYSWLLRQDHEIRALMKGADVADTSLAYVERLSRIRFHDMRHTHATLGLEAGIPPKVMQERLGHSSITMTLATTSLMRMPLRSTHSSERSARTATFIGRSGTR